MKNKFEWLDKNEYPFDSKYFKTEGFKLHYIDEGRGEILLFVHGTPSWSFDYRNVIKDLRNKYRCIAIDHMGFGLSDKPEVFDYSTLAHSLRLENFILGMNLRDITLVVHDFGGPIGLNIAMNHPSHFKKIVLLNSWLWNCSEDPAYIQLRKILKSPLLPFLYKYLNLSPRFLLPGSFGEKKLSKKLRKQYTGPFAYRSERNGPLAFARSLLKDQNWFGELWERKELIENIPILFLWGMKDPVISPAYLDKFISGFENSRVKKFETCGHFPQEEQALEVAASIAEFMNEK